MLIITIIFNITLLVTSIGSMIIDSKLLNNKFEILSISLMLSTVLLILEKFSIDKQIGWLSIFYKITLGLLCVIWTISILYTAFFNFSLKKKGYKYFYLFIIGIIFTIVLWTFSIYEIFYNPSIGADNTMFSDIMTIFAALCGGALTLGGVAWTLRHESQKTRNEKYSNIILTLDCKIESGMSDFLLSNSKTKSCNYYIVYENDIKDSNYMSLTLFYESKNYPLNEILIKDVAANHEIGFEEINFTLEKNIKTNIVQVEKNIYSFQIVFVGLECINKIKKLIMKNEFILNLSIQLKSMIGIETSLDIEVNFEGIELLENKKDYALKNATYTYKED